jgi:hypothetical protein
VMPVAGERLSSTSDADAPDRSSIRSRGNLYTQVVNRKKVSLARSGRSK